MREDASALVTIGRATVSMTHDLNNLLMVIGGYAEAIQRENDVSQLGAMAARIGDVCLSASRMTRYILSLVRHQDENPGLVNVTEHIRSIEGVLFDLAGPSASVHLELSEDPLWVFLRKSFLDQILVNLVVNSREANATSIKIRTVAADYGERTPLPRLQLEVQDNGKGFSEAALKHASRGYFSEGKLGGTGIGLATVDRLARWSNGSLILRNRHNRLGAVAGVQLRLQLPVLVLLE